MIDTDQLATLHALLGQNARLYRDVQKTRIAAGNRVDALDRQDVDDSYMAPVVAAEDALGEIERNLNRQLETLAGQHFMADWIRAQPGIGLPGFALLLGVTGPLDRFGTVSKLWKYLGLAVSPEGVRYKRKAGQSMSHTNCTFAHHRACPKGCKTDHHPRCTPNGVGDAYAPMGLVTCHQIGEAIVKIGKGPWRAAYDRRKGHTETSRPEWTKGHRHNDAMRVAVKALLAALWQEWQRRRAVAPMMPMVGLPV